MRAERAVGLLIAATAALYFGATAARDLQPFDSAELAQNAVELGVGHPPGQPLYLVLSAGVVRALPWVSPSWALALLSIAATATGVGLAAEFALGAGGGGGWLAEALAVWAAGVAVFLLPGVWDMATRVEVYPAAAVLVVGAVLLAMRPGRPTVSRLVMVGGLLGLSASVNPAMAVAGAVAAAPPVLAGAVALGARRGGLALLGLVGAGLGGLLPYALLPLLGAHPRDALVWGEPLRGDSLVFYLLGRDYRAWHLTTGELLHNLGAALGWSLAQGLLPWLVLGSLGLLVSPIARAARLSLPLGAACALSLLSLNHPFIPSNPDYDGYLLPWAWLSLAGVGAALMGLLRADDRRRRVLAAAAVGALALGGALNGPSLLARSRGASHVARALAARLLDACPPSAMLVLESDHLVFPALYLQSVEHRRPDVTVVNLGFANSGWYFRYLARRDPSLPAPRDGAPSREARVAALLHDAGRPVAAERLRLAALAGSACLRGPLALGGAACAQVAAAAPGPSTAAALAALTATAAPGSLDERLLATTAIAAADDLARAGAPLPEAFAVLRAALSRARLGDGRCAAPPPDGPNVIDRTPLTEPRALLSPAVVLLRLGDLWASRDVNAAADCYRRAEIPEADAALGRLVHAAAGAAQPRPPPADPPR